jgi:hypothetical protein
MLTLEEVHITALPILAEHARYKVWVKANGEMRRCSFYTIALFPSTENLDPGEFLQEFDTRSQNRQLPGPHPFPSPLAVEALAY